ncbi:g7923 [Coccomyxa elongata]
MQDRPNTARKPLIDSAGSKTPLRGRRTSEADPALLNKPRRPTIAGRVKVQNSSKKTHPIPGSAPRSRLLDLPSPRVPVARCRSAASTPRGSENGDPNTPRSLREQLDAASTSASDNVKVVVRVRPSDADEAQGSLQQLSGTQVSIVSAHEHLRTYEFDNVLGPATSQEDTFKVVGSPFVAHLLQGFNVTLFAYGQTAAGKTHTMTGNLKDRSQVGLAPRLLEQLFLEISNAEASEGEGKVKFTVKISYLELYKEEITDLLGPADAPRLQLREDVHSGVYVEGLTEREILNAGDAMAVVEQGSARRRTNETRMNQESSRSHAVLTVYIESWTKADESEVECIRSSRLNLVDLAGSERNKSSGATGERLKEACSINQSLTTLGRVISELVEAQQAQQQGSPARHIPYRESRLTFLLQDSLGGNSKTLIIACVSPAEAAAAESASTLEFAARAKRIRNRARVNRDTRGDAALLRAEIERLRRELELRDAAAAPLAAEAAELQRRLQAAGRGEARMQRQPDEATAQELKAATDKIKRLKEDKEDLQQEKDSMQRKASHLEASCSNLTEEVQRTRLDVLAERKVVLSLRCEVSDAKKAQAALAEQMQRLQGEAKCEREAAQARERQLQAKCDRLQEEKAEVERRAVKWKGVMQSLSENVSAAVTQAQTPKSGSKNGGRRPTLPDLEVGDPV